MTLVLISGIALGACCTGYDRLAWGAAGAAGLGCAGSILFRRPALGLPLILFFALGYLSIQPWLGGRLPADHVYHYADQGKWQLHGIIADQPRISADRVRFLLEATCLADTRNSHTVRGRVRITARGDSPALSRGDRIVLSGNLNAVRNFNNPGGFDYQRYMALQGVRCQMSVRGDRVTVLSPADQTDFRAWLDGKRHRLGMHMDLALAGHDVRAASLLKALTIGERSEMGPDLRDQFNRAGVAHVLAISGLHIGMVAAAVFFVFRILLAWIPILLCLAWTRKGAAAASLLAVFAYALLAGLSPSTQRAAIMATVFLMTYWFGRRHDWLNAAALAALTIALIHPPAVLSISFQLSFAAVLVILAGLRGHKADRSEVDLNLLENWIRRVRVFVQVSILALAGTLPLLMIYFNQVSVAGVAANLVVVPLVGWMVLPLGMAGILGFEVVPGAAYFCWRTAGYGLDAVLQIVGWTSRWPYAAFQTIIPSMAETAIYYGALLLWLNWARIPRRRVFLVLVLAAFLADAGYWVYQRYVCRDLRLTVLDVGQGSASLLQLPGGRTVMVDGGGFGDNTVFDVGRSLVAPYLRKLKILTVDMVVLTHPNSDHLNGLLHIVEHFNVAEIWSNHEAADTQGYQQWQEAIDRLDIHHPPFERLAPIEQRWGVIFEILSPEPGFLEQRSVQPWRNDNEDSLVLRVRKGAVSFLFCGDIGQKTEKVLLRRWSSAHLQSTVLLVPHHGSRHSSAPAFLQAVRPSQAVVACGWRNRYGFPHPQVLKHLSALSCAVWRTDYNGAIRISTDGDNFRVRPTLDP